MLIDYIDPIKLPHLVLWLDWNFYAYRTSLVLMCFIFLGHWFYLTGINHLQFSGLFMSLFFSFCAWNVYCVIQYGYGLG